MRPSLPRQGMTVAAGLVLAMTVLASACSSPSGTTMAPSTGGTVALGTNNPAQGDCTTNTSEAATAVGSVALDLTATTFQAQVVLQSGPPDTAYGLFMQQVPGSCPQPAANAGSLTTDSAGRGQASTTVPRVPGATTFYVQLVPGGAGAPTYTSDRISVGP
ncbi:MAG TPA: hypothetical protein VEI48_10985 [Candidatus Sulfotelmatobacter sp.]|nr:hypothetical protein [Candidatus Sulfotelmatobacter sp.]